MRLTLRTLLAWLDDTLQPTQVREIGRQVAESPFAQELSERIHRVTRQRRLSVPSSSGSDATDANVVASYLDNDLDPEAVAEYEKKCLTSDVKLAEVASVHQILSLLGQRVKVLAEARTRMYQLVKGREALRPRPTDSKRAQIPEPLTKPIQPWVVPEASRRSLLERFGPLAAGLALIGLSILTASWSLRAPQTAIAYSSLPAGAGVPGEAVADIPSNDAAAGSMPAGPDGQETAPTDDARVASDESSVPAGADAAPASKPIDSADSKAANAVEPSLATKDSAVGKHVPADASGIAEADGVVLLRYNNDQREWDRLVGSTSLSKSERILCLSPFRATITLAKIPVVLTGETEVRILSRAADKVPAIELIQGRLLVRNPPASSLKVGFSDRNVTLELTPSSSVVLERVDRREYGQTVTQAPPLVVYCTAGEVPLAADLKREKLTVSDVVAIDTAGGIKRTSIDTPPAWATDAEPSPRELQVREQFLRMFHPGRPVLTEIVVASEDDNADIKRLSILALKSLGDLSLLMPMLSRKDDPVTRSTALNAIRTFMGLGRESANRVRDQLAEEFGDDTALFVEKMLIGIPHDEASNPQIYERLVSLLGPERESVGIRELALDTLERLTGRDDLGYDPDHPEGKGLNAWKDLQKQGKLRFSASRGKTK